MGFMKPTAVSQQRNAKLSSAIFGPSCACSHSSRQASMGIVSPSKEKSNIEERSHKNLFQLCWLRALHCKF